MLEGPHGSRPGASTPDDRARAHALKVSWTRVALERKSVGAPGNYGYSLFAASKADVRKLREVHLEYVRAMQRLIAASKPGECVAPLLDPARTGG
jgi:hypothetical protein